MSQRFYHILGADIPHHNWTVLAFFQQQILPKLNEQQHHFYVVGNRELSAQFPALALKVFSSKKAIAKAVIQQAKQEPCGRFLLHGQFNLWLWFAILTGKLPACRCIWHVWGADLYQDSPRWRFKLFYPIRRLVQRKLPEIWATRGDLAYAKQHLNRTGVRDQVIYFPTYMPQTPILQAQKPTEYPLTVLLGNSGDRSNRHLLALTQLKRQLGDQIKIIIPMGYPLQNQGYIKEVQHAARQLFPQGQVEILTHSLAFADYLILLSRCDLGYFAFKRQQGIGTICLLTALNIPVALSKENPFCMDMQAEAVPFLDTERLDFAQISGMARALAQKDKAEIAFFPQQYQLQWLSAFTEVV